MNLSVMSLLGVFGLTAALSVSAEKTQATDPAEMIQTMEKTFGVHHGYRRNHAKGLCAMGEFQATPEAKNLSRSPLFSGKKIPVITRFSAAGGVPTVSDANKIPRGLAIQYAISKSETHNMSMINAPIFLVATPEAFLETFKISGPADLEAFMKRHPESKPFFAHVGGSNPTASYATSPYYSLNAFKFINAQKKEQYVRWKFVPDAGDVKLTDIELAKVDPNYLETEFQDRVKKGPVKWKMVAILAEGDDSVVNPSQPWPADRKTVTMGTLKLLKYQKQAGGKCEKINFDPTLVSDGVAISDDPILKFRSPAYAISYGKRLSDAVEVPADQNEKAKSKKKEEKKPQEKNI